MAITKAKKQDILSKLEGVKSDSDSIVFVSFRGLPVNAATAMRADLRSKGVGYFVAKKTLMKRAFDGAFAGSMPELEGEIAVAYS
ncbi:50S ribosomal protein L10, partial [Candidatus Saccharibacteria bacterium]|nr:50S ribosomal protein L10 [Candidatus Saccharibacteria bacterium]